MRVKVRLFASLREAAGRGELDLDLAEGATAEDAWNGLVARCPALAPRRRSLSAAVNRRYLPFQAPLSDGDEVVFIPPVSGG
jgi:molybdopterin converting factor subunit 1